MSSFTHLDSDGNAVMVDIGDKGMTQRLAMAVGGITMSAECYAAVRSGVVKKGDVLPVAQVAGIMAVKQTAALIPLCHTLLIEKATIDFEFVDENNEISVSCSVKTYGKTGVEMEALTGASVALLTIYDMCKAIDKGMVINGVRLVQKSGGKEDYQAYD